jgi:dihydrofolate reductase
MHVILSMAMSANGIIATKSGDEDFLPRKNWDRFTQLTQKTGCLIWGRKTHETVADWGGDYLESLKAIKKVIVSRSSIKLKEGFVLASSPEEALKLLDAEGFKKVVIAGGSTLNTAFAKMGLINEVRLDLNPVLLGDGIPLFSPADFDLKLKCEKVEEIGQGIVEITYSVV